MPETTYKRIPRTQHSFQENLQFADFRQPSDPRQPLCQMENWLGNFRGFTLNAEATNKKKIGIYQIDKVSDYYCKKIERPTVPSLTRRHNEQGT